MKSWFSKNYKTIIISAFLIPIITVAIVSISHVTKWYGISNPLTWAVYLSIGVEIAALSALAAISADMGKKVYFPFGIVTLVQFIGNIYFAYSFIDVTSQSFTSWVELVSPLLEYIGVEPTDLVGHKRFLAFFAGGMLPIISLSFLHMLVKFTQSDKNSVVSEEPLVKKSPEPVGEETPVVNAKDIVAEVSKVRLQQEELVALENYLSRMQKSNKDSETKINQEETQVEEEYIPTKEEEDENNRLNDVFLIEDHLISEQSQPIIQEPVSEQTIVEEPVVEEPVVEEPIVEPQPIVEEPIVEPQPIVEEPIVEPQPIVEEPIIEVQPIEETVVEEPIIEEPQTIEEPVFEQPIEEPVFEQPIEELPSEEEKKN